VAVVGDYYCTRFPHVEKVRVRIGRNLKELELAKTMIANAGRHNSPRNVLTILGI
jgi:hypothetical protein